MSVRNRECRDLTRVACSDKLYTFASNKLCQCLQEVYREGLPFNQAQEFAERVALHLKTVGTILSQWQGTFISPDSAVESADPGRLLEMEEVDKKVKAFAQAHR